MNAAESNADQRAQECNGKNEQVVLVNSVLLVELIDEVL